MSSHVDLFPHRQAIIDSTGRFEWGPSNIVEHDVGHDIVADVNCCPADVLSDSWNDIHEDLSREDQDQMDHPSTFIIDPIHVQIGPHPLIELVVIIILDFVYAQETARSASSVSVVFV